VLSIRRGLEFGYVLSSWVGVNGRAKPPLAYSLLKSVHNFTFVSCGKQTRKTLENMEKFDTYAFQYTK
jgi:hypothetical protein